MCARARRNRHISRLFHRIHRGNTRYLTWITANRSRTSPLESTVAADEIAPPTIHGAVRGTPIRCYLRFTDSSGVSRYSRVSFQDALRSVKTLPPAVVPAGSGRRVQLTGPDS
ncbi:hypothetical protein SCOCK_50147 [Actinacidiphila cocklensis]|uniref:Uncharacterized protein n=1 Tax=Actinacidiphila cocklensis TaxID=887465 RepID=A0A9W4DVT6_9ACTN|nr:hypothetical protein SCOCK_50147 [Actinacidiphila cocklensis]